MTTFTRRTSRLAAGLGIAGATVLLLAGPAAADTSQATANATTLSLGGAPALTTGTCAVTNPGTDPASTSECTETPAVLPFQAVLGAGVLAQSAVARPNGTSAACAGLLGAGGTITIGPDGSCNTLPSTQPTGGIVLNLGGVATLAADAILAQCVASSTGGATTPVVKLVNASITLLGGSPIPLTSMPAPNTSVLNVGPLLTATLNEQPALIVPPPPAGSVSATALDISVLSGLPGVAPLVRLTIGTVTCGPNAVTGPISIFSGPALPLAATAAVGVGAVAVIRRRRQTA